MVTGLEKVTRGFLDHVYGVDRHTFQATGKRKTTNAGVKLFTLSGDAPK